MEGFTSPMGCVSAPAIPEWGLVVLGLLVATARTLEFGRRSSRPVQNWYGYRLLKEGQGAELTRRIRFAMMKL